MRYAVMAILLIRSVFIPLDLCAQPDNKFAFRHMDQSDGLLHNLVFSIVQDGKGFIWILTRNGLQRYDGSRFVNYPYDVTRSGGAAYSSDYSLFADKKNNRLWVTSQHIEMLDLQKNNFTLYHREQLVKDPFFGFEPYIDSLNNPWLAGNFGVFPYDSSPKKPIPVFLTASFLSPNKSYPFVIDPGKDEAWFVKWGTGLLLFDKKTKRIYSHNYNPFHHPLLQLMDKKQLFFVFADSKHNIWISSSGPEFYQYHYATKKITTYSLSVINQTKGKSKQNGYTLVVNCFFEDDHHGLWLGTQNAGLLKYNNETDNFTAITTEKETKNSIQYNYSINCIFQDKEENIWLGTDKGITLFNPYRQYFQSICHDENNTLSLPEYEIQQCIETRNGDILTGTWGGGITVFDHQWHFKKNIHFTSGPEEYNLLWSFIQNDDGTIWAGCQHGYIHIYDPVKGSIRTIHPPELNNFTIRCMAKDMNGNILMGLHNGRIAKWDKLQQKFYSYNDSLPGIPLTFAPVFEIFIDNQQRCWAGTENGLKQFDMGKMTYSANYTADKNNPYSLSANTILSIDNFDDSTLVIGTLYGGINLLNTKTKTFFHLVSDDGLPSGTINNVKKDAANNLWFITDYCLYKYVPGSKKFTRYNIDPGVINSSFKASSFYCLKDGRWLANTATEIICFDPDSLQKQKAANPHVDITGFKIFDKDIFIDSLLYTGNPVKLPHRKNFLSIEYGALSYSDLQETKYYYQLTGIDKDWVYAGSKRFANYTNLEPGEYTFRVKTDDEGNTPAITSFPIIITPPFWETTWFRLILLMLAAAFIYFLFRKRIKSIRHEAEMKQKIAETEMMALRAQMNPHFIFNCINSIDALIQSNDKYHATVYLTKFAKLIRNILDSSKQNTVTLAKDLDTLKLYIELEQLRHENKFTAEIRADDSLLQDDYKVPSLIIQPFVENAILHGIRYRPDNKGVLSVSVHKLNGFIQFIIEDNGVGRATFRNPAQNEKLSYGIGMSNSRVKLFNNEEKASVQITDLYDKDKPAGTKVEVLLKIQ